MNNRLYGNLIFELSHEGRRAYSLPENKFAGYEVPAGLRRKDDAMLPECDEMTVVRHYTNHSENNFGVNNGFYPLGSCTMKYNPAINEEVAAMPEFANLHPLQPADTCQGALEAYDGLQRALSEISGLAKFTLNPFAGAHGELTGLMVIRSYHERRGDTKRTKVIVPDSAHGTNPASAAVCGLDVVEVKSTPEGIVDVEDLRSLLDDSVAAMMMTNPNTLGLFEREIPEIAKLVHGCGALMYYDGANLNPMLGVCRPGDMGFDVMHINLHKTFSTPHGGGGPGAGPVGVRKGLEELLPGEPGISVGPYHGNFAVLLRAYAYILTLGREQALELANEVFRMFKVPAPTETWRGKVWVNIHASGGVWHLLCDNQDSAVSAVNSIADCLDSGECIRMMLRWNADFTDPPEYVAIPAGSVASVTMSPVEEVVR